MYVVKCIDSGLLHLRGALGDLQKISNTNDDRIQGRTNRINTEPPRPRLARLLLNDKHILLYAILRDDHLLGVAVPRDSLSQGLFPVDCDVATLSSLVRPPGLLRRLEGHQEAGDYGEHDEEDACASVGTAALRRPQVRVEGRAAVCLEGHHHVASRGRGIAPRVAPHAVVGVIHTVPDDVL